MNGFKTARALVIDDDPAEAVVAIRALGSIGIGSVYHDGESPPKDWQKYTGLRLLVLDMVLRNRGANGEDPKADMSYLMAAVQELFEPGHDSVVAVCWTRHPKTVDLLHSAFLQAFPNARLAAVVLAEKGDLKDPGQLSEFAAKVTNGLQQDGPCSLLFGWEQIVHDSATLTTGALYEFAHEFGADPAAWTSGAYAIGAALAIAERGSRLEKEEGDSAVKAFTNSLVPLLADRIEHADTSADDDFKKSVSTELHDAVVKELKAHETGESLLNNNQRADLNSRIHISTGVAKGEICPGNVYLLSAPANRTATAPVLSNAEWPNTVQDTFFDAENPDKALNKPPQGAFAAIIEITPPCDFAQAKSKLHRFCLAFGIPFDAMKLLRADAAYVRVIGPMRFDDRVGAAGNYYLALNCHYIFGLPPTTAKNLEPAFRLRSSVLSDLISWQSAQASRPGYTEVR